MSSGPYCEGFNGVPEYYSVATAFFMVMVGMFGFLVSGPRLSSKSIKRYPILYSTLYCLLFINGIGSAIYHYYGVQSSGEFLDDVSLLSLLLTLIIGFLPKIVGHLIHSEKDKNVIIFLIYSLVLGSAIYLIQFGHDVTGYCIIVCFPLCMFLMVFLVFGTYSRQIKGHIQGKKAFFYTYCGAFMVATGAISWVVYERVLCPTDPKFYSKIPIHGFWHIISTAGLYLGIQVSAFAVSFDEIGEHGARFVEFDSESTLIRRRFKILIKIASWMACLVDFNRCEYEKI